MGVNGQIVVSLKKFYLFYDIIVLVCEREVFRNTHIKTFYLFIFASMVTEK